MAPRIAFGSATVWHTEDRGATWERTVYRLCNCEEQDASQVGQVGPNPSGGLTVFCYDSGFSPETGDYMASGACTGSTPPEGCRQVVSVQRYYMPYGFHHVEATAR